MALAQLFLGTHFTLTNSPFSPDPVVVEGEHLVDTLLCSWCTDSTCECTVFIPDRN